MTNEELQGHLDALDRAVSAGELQVRAAFTDAWHDASHGHRNTYFRIREDGSDRFRIKPKPREVYISIDEIPSAFCSQLNVYDAATFEPASASFASRFRKFREVTDE